MSRRPNSGKKTNLSQFGLIDIPDINDDDEPLDLSDDDFDLEAELAAISGGGAQRPKPKKPAPLPASNLDAMIAESLKDVPTDDEASGDDDDPDLLNELQALAIEDDDAAPTPPPRTVRPAPPPPGAPLSTDSSTISLLQDRITNYTVAEKNAKANGESSRARRFARGLKSLQDLLKQAKAGNDIKVEDIPPPVAVGKPAGTAHPESIPEAPQPENPEPKAPPPPPPEEAEMAPPEKPLIDLWPSEPSPPKRSLPEPPGYSLQKVSSTEEDSKRKELQIIYDRQAEFKSAALAAKRRGDKTVALELLRITKQFDMVVDAYKSGETMDLNELPTVAQIMAARSTQKQDEEMQGTDNTQNTAEPEEIGSGPLIVAKTLKEGLQQRLDAFRKIEAKAQEEGNSSKARRMQRIIKQYLDAIKKHERGLPIAKDELPAPPGHGPLPPDASDAAPPPAAAPRGPAPPAPSAHSDSERMINLLLLRHKQFKEAALFFKKKGDLEKARALLRSAKQMEVLAESVRAGRTVPPHAVPAAPPSLADLDKLYNSQRGGSSPSKSLSNESDKDSIGSNWDKSIDPRASTVPKTDEDIFTDLIRQLESQIARGMAHYKMYKDIGWVHEEKRIKKIIDQSVEDLNVMKASSISNGPVPKCHFVMRKFQIIDCNPDLNTSDLELTIVRGINYNVPNPKEVDTYVMFEFPFPQETPYKDRTSVVKDTNSPDYNATFMLTINQSRACQRVFKRHGIKFEVWSKGGWFRSDTLLGTVTVKLAPLQTTVTLHDSFPLIDGRRPTGGLLEVKLRLRTPLTSSGEQEQSKTITDRWLVLDDVSDA